MFDELKIRGLVLRDGVCEVEPKYFAFGLTASKIAAISQTSNLPPTPGTAALQMREPSASRQVVSSRL